MTIYKKGKIVKAAVTGIENYGIFVSLDEYYSGLIHISEISHGYVKDITDFVNIGDIIDVEVLDVDEELCQLKLSIKNINYKRNNNNIKRKVIKETSLGFKTLAYKLPIWIDENLQKIKN
ncbi:MAG: CvfD/Ygs/GSP13 family RNA-binding post-transcriptional regulator [Ignavibacteriales bacterium]